MRDNVGSNPAERACRRGSMEGRFPAKEVYASSSLVGGVADVVDATASANAYMAQAVERRAVNSEGEGASPSVGVVTKVR